MASRNARRPGVGLGVPDLAQKESSRRPDPLDEEVSQVRAVERGCKSDSGWWRRRHATPLVREVCVDCPGFAAVKITDESHRIRQGDPSDRSWSLRRLNF